MPTFHTHRISIYLAFENKDFASEETVSGRNSSSATTKSGNDTSPSTSSPASEVPLKPTLVPLDEEYFQQEGGLDFIGEQEDIPFYLVRAGKNLFTSSPSAIPSSTPRTCSPALLSPQLLTLVVDLSKIAFI